MSSALQLVFCDDAENGIIEAMLGKCCIAFCFPLKNTGKAIKVSSESTLACPTLEVCHTATNLTYILNSNS